MSEKVKIFKEGNDWIALSDGWRIVCNKFEVALSQGTMHLKYPSLRMPNSINWKSILEQRGRKP